MPRGGKREGAGRPRKFIPPMDPSVPAPLSDQPLTLGDAQAAVLEAAALEAGKVAAGHVTLRAALKQSPRQAQVTIMRFWIGVACREAAKKGKALRQNVLAGALDRASEAANRAAPYYHARLAAVAIGMSPGAGGGLGDTPPGGAPPLEDVPYQVVINTEEAAY